MADIVINACYGGFSLSHEGKEQYEKIAGKNCDPYDIARDDPNLIRVVQSLGKRSWGACAELKIVQIPDDVEWEIEEYDGIEWVAEKHRIWR